MLHLERYLQLLLAADALFYYGLEAERTFIEIPMGYELFLNFAYPRSYDSTILLIGIVLCLLFAFLGDSYLGRMPIVMFGLSMLAISMCLFTLNILVNSFQIQFVESQTLLQVTIIMFLIYLSTSTIRNVLHLEQITLPIDLKELRIYIFWTLFLRLLFIFIFSSIAFTFRQIENKTFLYVHSTVNIVLTIVYSIILLSLLFMKRLYVERRRQGIWLQCITCFVCAVFPGKRKEARSDWALKQYKDQHAHKVGSLAKPTRHEELPRRKLADSVITSSMGRVSTGNPDLTKHKKTYYAYFLLTLQQNERASGRKKRRPDAQRIQKSYRRKSMPVVIENLGSSNYILQNEAGKSGRSIAFNSKVEVIDVRRSWIPSWLPGGLRTPSKEDDPYIELKQHWLYRAKNKSTLSVMEETRKFWLIKFIFLTLLTFNISSYFLLTAIILQEQVCRKTKYPIINELTVFEVYNLFNVVIFPFFEYLIAPVLKRIYSDLKIVVFASFLLLLALCLGVAFQKYLEYKLKFIPTHYFAQMRIFNALPFPITVGSSEFHVKVLQPYHQTLVKHLRGHGTFKVTVQVKSENNNVTFLETFELEAYRTHSCIASEKGLVINSNDPDPTIYVRSRNDSFSSYFIITVLSLEGNISFKDIATTAVIKQPIPQPGAQMPVFPSVYVLNIETINNVYAPESFEFEAGGLYGIFFYRKNEGIYIKIFLVEGPPPLSIIVLLIPIVLLCCAQALVTVGFFMFLFIESSPKLRCTVFTSFYLTGFITVILSVVYDIESTYSTFSNVLFVVIFIQTVGLLSTIYSCRVYVYQNKLGYE